MFQQGNTLGRRHGSAPAGKKTRTYVAWVSMKQRCRTKRYADRGITVCEDWSSFENFLADMGECPDSLTLERRDNDKGYSKSNCVWASMAVQGSNRSNTRLVTFRGETMHISAWARRFGIPPGRLWWYVKTGQVDRKFAELLKESGP